MAAATQEASTASTSSGGSTQWLRPHLLKLAAYTPIEPFEILAERYGRTPDQIIKLDANENPYGPPPEVSEALAAMPFPHIYPDPETRRLRKALAEMNDIPIEHLLVGIWIRMWGVQGHLREQPLLPASSLHAPHGAASIAGMGSHSAPPAACAAKPSSRNAQPNKYAGGLRRR